MTLLRSIRERGFASSRSAYETNRGNDSGTIIGNFPEAFAADRNYPDGRLPTFERHRLRLWSVYAWNMGRLGDLSVSGLWRVDSALTYSLAARNQRLTPAQVSIMTAAGYPDAANLAAPGPISGNAVFFEPLGSQQFAGYAVADVSANYNVPVFRTLRPWINLDVYNLFDNQKLIAWNTTSCRMQTRRVMRLGCEPATCRATPRTTGRQPATP